jgi:hypothetical protein
MVDSGIIYPEGGETRQIGGKTVDELLFWWGRHDGRRAGDSNFVLLGVACKKDSHGRLAANQDHVEMARLGCGSGIIMSRSMRRRRWATSYDDG